MKTLESRIIKEAKEWVGTPWQHHVGVKQIGCDCVHFIKGIADNLGIQTPEYKNYRPRPVDNSLTCFFADFCKEEFSILPGYILIFAFNQYPSHVAIASDKPGYMIHASQTIGKIIEQRIDDSYKKRLIKIYKLWVQ